MTQNALAQFLIQQLRDPAILECQQRALDHGDKLATEEIAFDAVDYTIARLLTLLDDEVLEIRWRSDGEQLCSSDHVDAGEAKGWYFGDSGWIDKYSSHGHSPVHKLFDDHWAAAELQDEGEQG